MRVHIRAHTKCVNSVCSHQCQRLYLFTVRHSFTHLQHTVDLVTFECPSRCLAGMPSAFLPILYESSNEMRANQTKLSEKKMKRVFFCCRFLYGIRW